jgi:hypothetical protein
MFKIIDSKKSEIIFFLSFISLIFSFFLNEDGSGGGARGDFEITYGFIIALQENLLADPKDWTLVHTPLHFIILSYVTRIIEDPYILRFLFCFISFFLPLTFYLSISHTNQNKSSRKILLILSSCIFFVPSFRYTSIWANDLVTSIFFFICSIYFFKRWENNRNSHLDKNLLLQILFLVLATYTRQYFAVFFVYFLFRYYQVLTKINFLKLFGICVLSSLPVLFYTYKFPELLTGQVISINALNYFLLGNSSIMSITLYPIFLINVLYKNINYKKFLVPSLLSFFIVLVLSMNFNPINWQGGAINFMISKNFFGNHFYFYFSSFFTFSIFIYLCFECRENIVILLILLFMFFSYQVYQRYYDPMFFIIFFTFIKTDLTKIFYINKNSSLLLLLYYISYYLLSISDLVYKI